jgi:hypothetical protein
MNAHHSNLFSGNQAGKLQANIVKKSATLDWSDIPKTDVTPELAQDLKVLSLRNYIDPKHFYKTKSRNKLPTHFHVSHLKINIILTFFRLVLS